MHKDTYARGKFFIKSQFDIILNKNKNKINKAKNNNKTTDQG